MDRRRGERLVFLRTMRTLNNEYETSFTCRFRANEKKLRKDRSADPSSSSLIWELSYIKLKKPAAGTLHLQTSHDPDILESVNTQASGWGQMTQPTRGSEARRTHHWRSRIAVWGRRKYGEGVKTF